MDTKSITILIMSAVSLVNAVCAMLNVPQLNIDEQTVYAGVSVVFTVVMWAATVWKNFPFTKAAQAGQVVIDEIKAVQKAVPSGVAINVSVDDSEKADE